MKKFEKAELACRTLFNEFLLQIGILCWMPSESLYESIDGIFIKDDIKIAVEIKKRLKAYEKFDTHLMEIEKYNSIIKLIKNKKLDTGMYACFFGSDILYIYDIKLIRKVSKIEYYWCPKTTEGDNRYCYKKCYMIPKKYGIKYIKINNKWIKTN